MIQWNPFTDKFIRRYRKFRYHYNIFKNLARLRFHRHNFPDPGKVHITCAGSTDGGCSQFGKQLSTISFTRAFGFTYVHTPLSHVAHNIDNIPHWPDKWENYLQLSSFGEDRSRVTGDFKIVKNMNELLSEIIRRKKEPENQYYQIKQCHSYTNRVPEAHLIIIDKLRELYKENDRSVNLIYNTRSFNIAFHVRRGDVTEEKMPNRFTSAKKLENVIQKIQGKLGDTEHTIYLFCVSLDDDLKKLETDQIKIIHKFDIFDVLDHLIHTDLLVTSKSSVGYVAGFLNDDIVIYEPFWHPPLPGWLNIDEDFEPKLEQRLTQYLTIHS